MLTKERLVIGHGMKGHKDGDVFVHIYICTEGKRNSFCRQDPLKDAKPGGQKIEENRMVFFFFFFFRIK